MEARFRHSFAAVRIHADEHAAVAAGSVDARAFTVGSHIVFAPGEYRPGTAEGRVLLAHELTHVVQQSSAPDTSAPLRIGQPEDVWEGQAQRMAVSMTSGQPGRSGEAGSDAVSSASPMTVAAIRGPAYIQRLGANPGCTKAQADAIHQAIYDARGWLNKAIRALRSSPLAAPAQQALRRNFGPQYGVPADADLIRGRLETVLKALGSLPISCVGPPDPFCVAGHCGLSTPGSHASALCTNVTFGASSVFQAGCVLHEAFHATFSGMTPTHDFYSGWHGASSSTPGYPGTGLDPLLNADSYTSLVMDLS